MRFLKGLAVVYLVWAIGYSVVVMPSWIGDALAFKLNGGTNVIWAFEENGFRINSSVGGAATNGNLSLSIGYNGYPYLLRYFWGPGSEAALRMNVISNEEPFSLASWKIGKNWGILVAPLRRIAVSGKKENPKAVKKALLMFETSQPAVKWFPLTELRFFIDSIPVFDLRNSFLNHIPPVGLLVLFLTWLADIIYFPLAILFAVLIAFSPPAIAGYTIYLPIVILLSFLIYKFNRLQKEKR